jgi:DNA-binding Lrp family transcriptional regulator
MDARRSLRDIAAEVGVSATTVHDRARAMQRRGLIRGAYLDLGLRQIDRGVQALVAVRIRPPSRANIESFRDWVDALYAFVIDRLTSRAEIADVETSVIYEHLRTMTFEP